MLFVSRVHIILFLEPNFLRMLRRRLHLLIEVEGDPKACGGHLSSYLAYSSDSRFASVASSRDQLGENGVWRALGGGGRRDAV